MDKLKQQLEEARGREEEKGAEVRQLEGEVRRLQRALEQAETRERTLTQEAKEVHVRRIHNVNVCDRVKNILTYCTILTASSAA